ncbi:helix-turn-helix transcriptional regulator [Nocardia macrotermitis]|uniref:HTH cro/C1-type domain-containing protein n=1 Tax=Nocardia macrotermitis TaxID=2585198 RepID=A0A7K0D6M7_9NOCA|nr:helix-turn-helix transcriptional regulator [Nocardia macrotermitis]MQY21406.1 hypothetical protein [Nocardia macrotermitis]
MNRGPTNNPITEPATRTTVADELAREIKRLRLEIGLSQRALAAKIGYSRQYVPMAEWENSDLPSAELIRAIDTALCAGGELIALRARAGSRQRAEISTTYPSQHEAAREIRDLTLDADTIDVMAIRGLGILGLNDSLLRDSLPAQAKLRVLLMDPGSDAVATRAQAIGESAESFAAGIKLSIARIKELADAGRPVEIYTYRHVPVWRIIRIDAVLFVSAFTTNREGHTSPTHRFEPNDQGVLHHAFVSTFEQAVSNATRIV